MCTTLNTFRGICAPPGKCFLATSLTKRVLLHLIPYIIFRSTGSLGTLLTLCNHTWWPHYHTSSSSTKRSTSSRGRFSAVAMLLSAQSGFWRQECGKALVHTRLTLNVERSQVLNTVEPLWKGQECPTEVAKIRYISMHHCLQIMFILPLMTGHLFRKATKGGLYTGVPLYTGSMCPTLLPYFCEKFGICTIETRQIWGIW